MKKLLAVFTVLSMLFALPANAAGMNFGFSLMAGQFDTDGSETEKSVFFSKLYDFSNFFEKNCRS